MTPQRPTGWKIPRFPKLDSWKDVMRFCKQLNTVTPKDIFYFAMRETKKRYRAEGAPVDYPQPFTLMIASFVEEKRLKLKIPLQQICLKYEKQIMNLHPDKKKIEKKWNLHPDTRRLDKYGKEKPVNKIYSDKVYELVKTAIGKVDKRFLKFLITDPQTKKWLKDHYEKNPKAHLGVKW